MKASPALKSSLFVAILAGLLAFPFSGFGLIAYTPEEDVSMDQYAAVLGATTIPVRATTSVSSLNIVHQEDLSLNLSQDSSQKFYNVLPEEYVSDEYEIVVIVPNEIKEQGLKAVLEKSDLTYDLVVEMADSSLEYQQIDLSLIVFAR